MMTSRSSRVPIRHIVVIVSSSHGRGEDGEEKEKRKAEKRSEMSGNVIIMCERG